MFLEFLNLFFSTRYSFVILFVIVIILFLFLAIRLYRTGAQEYARKKSMYVAILLNEDAISLPIILAIELVEALSEPEANDVAIEIYRNQEKNGWIDLKFKRFLIKKKLEGQPTKITL